MSPSPTAEIAQIGQVDREYAGGWGCGAGLGGGGVDATPSICSTQSGVIFGNTPLGSDNVGLLYSMNSGDILC